MSRLVRELQKLTKDSLLQKEQKEARLIIKKIPALLRLAAKSGEVEASVYINRLKRNSFSDPVAQLIRKWAHENKLEIVARKFEIIDPDRRDYEDGELPEILSGTEFLIKGW